MTKNDLITGDLVLAKVVDDVLPFEFYGWWDDHRCICTLVVPHNGLTFLAVFDQVICRLTKEKVIRLNNDFFRKNRGSKCSLSQQVC
jgi:hypothetical protein